MPGCLVSGCTSGYKSNSEKVNFFSVPKDEELRKKWQIALKRPSSLVVKTQVVCGKHFLAGDILRKRLLLSPEGDVIGVSPYRRPRLAIGAVPSLFPWTEVIPTNNENENIQEPIREALEVNESSEICLHTERLKKQQEEEAAQGIFHDIQEQETSGPLLNIKEEISIDESVLEDYHIPKLETFENESVDTTDDVDPLSLSYMEIESRCSNKNESTNLINIIPKLETFENASEDMVNVEEDIIFPRMQNQPVQETRILRSTLKNNTNFSSSSSNTSRNRKRKLSDEDSRVEDHDFPSREDYVDYAMYVAARLKNSKQSDSAISIAKEKIELILCDLDKGLFENLMAVPFS